MLSNILLGMYRLFKVAHFSLPKDWIDMPNFVYMYEAVIKWVVSICQYFKASICDKVITMFFYNILILEDLRRIDYETQKEKGEEVF